MYHSLDESHFLDVDMVVSHELLEGHALNLVLGVAEKKRREEGEERNENTDTRTL